MDYGSVHNMAKSNRPLHLIVARDIKKDCTDASTATGGCASTGATAGTSDVDGTSAVQPEPLFLSGTLLIPFLKRQGPWVAQAINRMVVV